MQRFMLYAHRNTASDNRVRCERNVQQNEGSNNAGFPWSTKNFNPNLRASLRAIPLIALCCLARRIAK